MLGLERPPVHFIGEQNLGAQRVRHGQAARVVVLVALLSAVVGSGEDQLHCIGLHSGVFQNGGEGSAGPLSRADGLVEPRLADWAGQQPGATVAGTFERDGHRLRGPRADVVETEFKRASDVSGDAQAPGNGIEVGDIEVDEQVVEAGGRHVIAERFERQTAVARGQL